METPVSSSTPAVRTKGLDEKFCGSCGEVIKIQAEICPKCGVRQHPASRPISKGVLLLLTFFLGGLGAHKFYVGKTGLGVLYLLFCWTFIPAFIALIEFFIYAFTDEEKLQAKYMSSKGKGGAAVAIVVACVIGLLMIFGILGAVAVPLYIGYTNEAHLEVANNTAGAVASACGASHQMDPTDVRIPSATGESGTISFPMQGTNNTINIPKGYKVTIDKAEGTVTCETPDGKTSKSFQYR